MSDSDIESVIVRLHNLELTITARVIPGTGGTTVGASVASTVGAATFHDPFAVSEQLEEQAIAARDTRALEALPLPFWTPRARIARAFRAGVVARRQLDGQIQCGVSLNTPFRNSVYVVLRDRDSGASFWTASYPLSARSVLDPADQSEFSRGTVSHAFASQAEAEAYCAGTRTRWPQERQG